MQLAPGPSYLLRRIPYFAIPSTFVYACLTLAKQHLGLAIPSWLTVFAAVFARPGIFIFNRYYSRFSDSRNAALNNATLAPHIRESAFTVISKLSQSFRDGYPGKSSCWPCTSCSKLTILCCNFFVADIVLDYAKEYGNAYQLRLFTDNRVRVFTPESCSIKMVTFA
jgi:hypothetical protein